MEYVAAHGRIERKHVIKLCGISENQAKTLLGKMCEKGKLKNDGKAQALDLLCSGRTAVLTMGFFGYFYGLSHRPFGHTHRIAHITPYWKYSDTFLNV